MADWEYCMLWLDKIVTHEVVVEKKRFPQADVMGKKYGWDCWINYMDRQGSRREQISEGSQIRETNPFNDAMGLLGSIGWELVGVQHGIFQWWHASGSTSAETIYYDDTLSANKRVAYFKRQVQPGRAVGEPNIKQYIK